MKFESNLDVSITPEEKLRNYENNVDSRKGNSLWQEIFGTGNTKEDRIRMDAQLEDKYRNLEKNGIISAEELDILTRSNLIKHDKYEPEIGIEPGAEGVINGFRVNVTKFMGNGKKDYNLYRGRLNGRELDSETAKFFLEKLLEEIKRKDAILKKIKEFEIRNLFENK